jgi:hypothetical protein
LQAALDLLHTKLKGLWLCCYESSQQLPGKKTSTSKTTTALKAALLLWFTCTRDQKHHWNILMVIPLCCSHPVTV